MNYLTTEDGKPINKGNPLDIKDPLDLRGLAAKKPAANSVSEGATYWSVDTDPSAEAIEVSDGTKWTVM